MPGLTNVMKEARAIANRDMIDAAATPGKLLIYDTTRPATGGAAGAAALVTLVLNTPCGTVSESGVLTITPPAAATQIVGTGSPLWGRFTDGDGTILFDVSVGITDEEAIVDQEVFYAGAFVSLVSAQFAEAG